MLLKVCQAEFKGYDKARDWFSSLRFDVLDNK